MSDVKPNVIDAQQMNPPAPGWTVQSHAQLVPATIGYDAPAPEDEGGEDG
jgi:hypothetical protein